MESKTKIIILSLTASAASFFNWLIVKQALYSNAVFTLNDAAQFWRWFWIRIGLPFASLGIFCALLAVFMIAVRSRLAAAAAGIIIASMLLPSFYSGSQPLFANYAYFACVIILSVSLAIGDGIAQREQAERVNFKAGLLAKLGLFPIIVSLMVILPALYYFSPCSKSVSSISIPDNLLNKVIGTVEKSIKPEKAGILNEEKDIEQALKGYFGENIPEIEGMASEDMVNDILKNIPDIKSGAQNLAENSLILGDIKKQVGGHLEAILSPYYKYLPIMLSLSFFFVLRMAAPFFSHFAVLLSSAIIKLCFALGIFNKETIVVEKERIVF